MIYKLIPFSPVSKTLNPVLLCEVNSVICPPVQVDGCISERFYQILPFSLHFHFGSCLQVGLSKSMFFLCPVKRCRSYQSET